MKNKVLTKASDLFLKYGFKSVTMDDIAKELGMSKKTIYSHYATKNKLVQDVAHYVLDQINKGISCICSTSKNPIEELFEIKSMVNSVLKNNKVSPQYQLEKYYPKIFKSLKQKQFESVIGCITNNLKTGIEQGFYRKNLHINFITRIYYNGSSGIQDEELFPKTDFEVSFLLDNFMEYHIRAIATEKGIKTLNKILNK